MARDEIKCVVANNTVTIPIYLVSIEPLKPVDHMVLWPNTLIEIDEYPFLPVEHSSVVILPLLHRVGDRLWDKFTIALCNQGGHIITLEENTTIGYVREAAIW